ncbi:MAG TPA: POTRA domain-containing protein [Verrucomicrobiae bacterium]|nr:POTRA domain-containing protein [Verrucomicrobiae bacterium]
MLLFAKIFVGAAEETNSSAIVENLFAEPFPTTNAAVKLLPALDVRSYRIEGNSILPPRDFGMLSNFTGQVDLPRVREGLDKLQAHYRNLGFSNVTVTLPEQKITNSTVRVKIIESETEIASETNLTAAITNLFAAPKPTIEIRGYRIEGNTALPPEEFSFLTNYTGQMDFAQIREGMGKLQLRYRDLGFPTISVALPQQKLTNGIVRVKIIEGRLNDIIVEGNRYYSSNNIVRALPSLTTNILLNAKWFQSELDRANLNQDRQIYPVIAPGLEPGTTELTLKVKDQFPFHGHMEINDKSTPNTPLLRLDTAVQYDNLWQLNHQVGFDYNFSPQEMKTGNYNFYDQPMVASYSGYYRVPLGFRRGLRDDYENLPVTFGYDEVTHRFNLPPATGNPELIFFASRSVSDTPVRYGPKTILFTNLTEDVYARSAERDLTFNDDLGAKLTIPVREFWQIQSSLQIGLDYKSYAANGYSTNLTTFDLYGLNPFDPTQRGSLITSSTVPLPTNTRTALYYLPISLGWVAARPDNYGSFSFNYNQNIFLSSLASARSDFQTIALSPEAGGNYTTVNAGLIRLQNLPDNWSAVLNVNGQWASEPVIGNEQFALGGTSGVRGYQEGENYGDSGWRALFDLRAPAVNVGYFPTPSGDVPANLRCSWFMDYGQIYLYQRPGVFSGHLNQWGTGLGFFLTAGEHFSARLTLAWALEKNAEESAVKPSAVPPVQTPAGEARAYFSIGYQF